MSGRLGKQQMKKLQKAVQERREEAELTERVWRSGYNCPVNPEVASEEIRRIMDQNPSSGVTAAQVLDAARPESSPIHRAFEWDDNKAAEQFRRDQARHLIRNVIVVNRVTNQTYPEFIFVPKPEGVSIALTNVVTVATTAEEPAKDADSPNRPHISRPRGIYQRTSDVAKDPDKLALAVGEMQASINSAKRKLEDVRQFVAGSDESGQMAMLVQLGTTLETALELSKRIH